MSTGSGGMMGALAGPVMGVANAALSYIPSKEERALQKQVEADRKRLANGGGGMSEGKLQQAQSTLANSVQAQQQQALAQLARGSAMGGGESGIATAKQLGVFGAGQQAMAQGQSQIREQDLAAAAQQRAANTQLQQQLIAMERARRQEAIGHLQQGMGMTPSQQAAAGQEGANMRGMDAAQIQQLAQQLAPLMAGAPA